MAMATSRNARAQLICVFRGWGSCSCATSDFVLGGLLTDFISVFFFDFELIGSELHFLQWKPVEYLSVPLGKIDCSPVSYLYFSSRRRASFFLADS